MIDGGYKLAQVTGGRGRCDLTLAQRRGVVLLSIALHEGAELRALRIAAETPRVSRCDMREGTVFLLALIFSCRFALSAEMIVGAASVIDGDTIEIHGQRIRLFGIDAPESGQICSRGGASYRCGQEAAFILAGRIGRQVVVCAQRDADRYGRVVAICSVEGVDLGKWLIGQGWALAYRKYSTIYVADEEAAKAAGFGLWAGEFQNPADARRGGSRGGWRTEIVTLAPARPSQNEEQRRAGGGTRFSGRCACPNDIDSAGRRCGRRSAYSRAGGASPNC